MEEIVFVTLLLGLLAGPQPVEVRVAPDVKSVRITVGALEVATLRQPPWRTTIDFGTNLEPGEVDAIAYDAEGNEVGRATQIVNLPHAIGEVAIAVKYERDKPSDVELIGRHLAFAKPARATIKVDDKALRVENFSARLPALDWTRSHVISAEMRFSDGTVARRELVLSGGIAYSAGSELTPVLITGKGEQLDGCFSIGDTTLRTGAVERPDALVIMVKDPGVPFTQNVIRRLRLDASSAPDRAMIIAYTRMSPDVTLRTLWPAAQRFGEGTQQPSMIFEHSSDTPGAVVADALRKGNPVWSAQDAPRLFADALAVAGLRTLDAPRRRAVVLLLGDVPDSSMHSPAEVRRYLAEIGVPLFVWSIDGPEPDSPWGEVQDIQRRDRLHSAIERLQKTLDAQRVVWLPVDPLNALRVKADPKCGVETVAKP